MRLIVFLTAILISATAPAEDAVEAASSCVVIHKSDSEDKDDSITCFENISLERTSFESGVCQWKSDSQATTQVESSTRFVKKCPLSYSGFCDRLVLGSNIIAPVKIFIYERSKEILDRASKQCLSGGGKWTGGDHDGDTED